MTSHLRHLIKPSLYVGLPIDTLNDVIIKQYGVLPHNWQLFSVLQEYLLKLNPEIKNPNAALGIYVPRTLDFVTHDPATLLCTNPVLIQTQIDDALKGGQFHHVDNARKQVPQIQSERDMFRFLTQVRKYADLDMSVSGVGLGEVGTMTGARNQAILRQLAELHAKRDLGQISRGLFKHQKAELIQKYVKAVGPLDRAMHETSNLQVKLQSGLVKGMNASESYLFEANRLAKLSRLAGKGGILLTVAGVGLTCMDIGAAKTNHDKNKILVKGMGSIVGGTFGGLASSLAIGVIVGSGPVGWTIALVASMVGGYFAGQAGSSLGKSTYDLFDKAGHRIDPLSLSRVGSVCR